MQFCPFPVYPGWQLHTYDPMVLAQFAFSWQEWFPLHSSTSMRSEIKKWDFKIMQKLPCISHYRVKDCKPCLFSTRDCSTWRKLNILLTVPIQFRPSPIYPDLHVHTYDPCVLLHAALLWHLLGVATHSSISLVKLSYQLKSLAFPFLSKSHSNLAVSKNLKLFKASCSEWLSGWNFQ